MLSLQNSIKSFSIQRFGKLPKTFPLTQFDWPSNSVFVSEVLSLTPWWDGTRATVNSPRDWISSVQFLHVFHITATIIMPWTSASGHIMVWTPALHGRLQTLSSQNLNERIFGNLTSF